MSIESICGPCMNGDHARCSDGLVEGLIGGWYCGCDHTPEGDEARRERTQAFLTEAGFGDAVAFIDGGGEK